MGFLDRLRGAVAGAGWDGRTGRPRSANGASSMHLLWDVPAGAWAAIEATLALDAAPTVPDLYFWALQVSFTEQGRSGGGAHLGLQWFPPHPGSTAVNWGGYGPSGGELPGSASALPSATGNPNTRDLAWQPGRDYRLRVERAPGGQGWRGLVVTDDGDTTVVRDLHAAGTHLTAPMVWSEVFAACDAPPVAVRWSALRVVDDDDVGHAVTRVRTNYQLPADGGCSVGESRVEGQAFVQETAVPRTVAAGALLSLS